MKSLRLLAVVLLTGLLWRCGPAPANAQTLPPRPSPTQIRADLDRILSRPEFLPATRGENPFEKLFRWLGERWEAFWRWLGRLFRGGGGISGATPGLQWIFIALFLALGAWLLSRLLLNYWRYRDRASRKERTAYDFDMEEPDSLAEPDVWLQQAQRYAAEGDYRRAFRGVFLAILLQLDRAGAIQYDRARTNGDYLRLLRAKSRLALYDLFRPLVAEFDVRWYGDSPTYEADYRRCRDEYERLRSLLTTEKAPGAGR